MKSKDKGVVLQDLTPRVPKNEESTTEYEQWRRGRDHAKCCLTPFLHFLALGFLLAACAGNPATANCPDNDRVRQSFVFGRYGENQDVEILNVFYGIPNCPVTYDSTFDLYNGKPMQGTSIHGPMRRAWSLNVKWRVVSTGQEYEENIDLRNRLPNDMTGHEIHFVIEGSKLIVYLITPERRPPDMPPNGPRPTQHLKTLTIYPDQAK